ncbi:hypothetical protein ACFYV7_29570 [Nocardia suismassiliense]|uniref:Uncharacterized protein n=1 Tax=Nocardia suismassiliense TaxID=2077092 RepID=A0ABW6R176_9NOCA
MARYLVAVTRSAPTTGGPPNLIRRWRTGRSELRSGFLDPIVAQFRALTAELSRTNFDAKAAPFDVISDVLAEVGADRSLTRMSASRNGECR